MLRKISLALFVVVLSLVVTAPALAGGGPPPFPDGSRARPVIFVTSQDLYYDSIRGPDLPAHGPFQLLEVGPNGLQTEFGPGDPEYVGGRWVLDTGDGLAYFSCPLLGPGRETP